MKVLRSDWLVFGITAAVLLSIGVFALSGKKNRDLFVQVNTRLTSTGGEAWDSAASSPSASPNAYYSNTYIGGRGANDRVEQLVSEGVPVSVKEIKLAAFPRRYSQAFSVPSDRAVNLEATLERSKIVSDGATTYLQVGLQAIKREAPHRPPLNLALVIDVSGSMTDANKLTFAKQASQKLVDKLGVEDTLALVVFDGISRVVIPACKVTDPARFRNAIENLTCGSGTNLYDGLQTGYQEVKRHLQPDSISRVVLLSDGIANVGITDIGSFRQLAHSHNEQEITCTTIGVGVDFNEEVMHDIAQEGRGNYHFIKDASAIKRVFDEELNDLVHVVARALRLRIHLHDGVELVKVFGAESLNSAQLAREKAEESRVDKKIHEELGIARDRKQVPDEPGIKMLIPHFYHGDTHVVMLEVRIPKGISTRKVADIHLKYKDVVFRQNRSISQTLSVTYTRNRSQMLASTRPSVVKNRLGFEVGEALIGSARCVNNGQISAAVKLLDERMVVLGVAAREWKDKDLDRDGSLLAEYKKIVSGVNPSIARNPEYGRYLQKSLTYAGYRLLQ